MTDASIDAFVEAILADRPPKEFRATPDNARILNVALRLRASQTEFAGPDPQYVEDLHRQLAATAPYSGAPLLPLPTGGSRRTEGQRRGAWRYSRNRSRQVVRPRWAALAKMAAAVALVLSTYTAANLAGGPSPAPAAQQAPATTVRSANLVTANGRPLGRSYAYSGNPSWVFIDVQTTDLNGMYTCELQLANGTTVTAGAVTINNGTGDWAHTVKVQTNQIRQATLVTSTGITVAIATFS